MSLSSRFLIPLKNKVRYTPFLRSAATRLMVNKDFPAVLGIDPTNRCNLKCAFCGPARMGGQKGAMPFELFRKIMDECKTRRKLWMLILHNFGEPLLNKDIGRMVAYAREKDVARSIQFSTNGTLLTEALSRELIRAGLDGLTLSVDALTKEEYRELKGADRLDAVMENARTLMRLKREMKSRVPHVSAKMVRRRGFEHAFKPFLKLWSGIVDETALTPYSNWGDAVPYAGTQIPPQKRFACHFPWYYPVINWDGGVFFCCAACRQDAVIGDVSRNTLESVWQSEAIKRIRSAHLRGDYGAVPACARCTYWAESSVNLDPWLKKKRGMI